MQAQRIFARLLGTLLAGSVTAAFAAAPAGELIENRASLFYDDAITGDVVEIFSNTSRVSIAELYRFALESPQSRSVRPGQRVEFTHRLSNTGNVSDSYTLVLDNAVDDDADLLNLFVYADANGNGTVDVGEPLIDAPVALEPGAVSDVIVSGVVPDRLPAGSGIDVFLHASSAQDTVAQQSVRDHIDVLAVPDILLQLANQPGCDIELFDSDEIRYTLDITNRTSAIPAGGSYNVDGQQQRGVLVEVPLPTGAKLIHGGDPDVQSFQSLLLVRPTGSEHWMRHVHWDGIAMLDSIALLIPEGNLELDAVQRFAFSLQPGSVARGALLELQAQSDWNADGQIDAQSNTVCNRLSEPAAAVEASVRFIEPVAALREAGQAPDFLSDSDFTDTVQYSMQRDDSDYLLVRDGVYIEFRGLLDEAQYIADAAGTAHVIVDLHSAGTGDSLQVLLRETDVDSGVFRSVRQIALTENMPGGNAFCPGDSQAVLPVPADYLTGSDVCTMQSMVNDTLTVSLLDVLGGVELTDSALIHPMGRIFDTYTLQGIKGAIVRIEQDDSATTALTGEPTAARGVLESRVAVARIRSDDNGEYPMPRLDAGDAYYFSVEPPEGYRFPSVIAPDRFPELFLSDLSYGLNGFSGAGDGRFSVADGQGPPIVDLPLDPQNAAALLSIDKTSHSRVTAIGDFVVYEVTLRNTGDSPLSDARVVDTPPSGFRFVAGSASLDGERIADPEMMRAAGSSDAIEDARLDAGTLVFSLGELPGGGTSTLQYRLQVTPTALRGDGINTAVASASTVSGLQLVSPVSSVRVEVNQQGVLGDKAILFGKLFVDSDCDAMQSNAEWPIAGVRLYLEDGTWVMTDEDGQFSLFGLEAGMHVLKVDTLTLPQGLTLKPLDTRHAADAHSRFVELTAGDFHRADFAARCPGENAEAVFDELRRRNQDLRGSWLLDEASRFNPDKAVGTQPLTDRTDTDGDLARGSYVDDSDRMARFAAPRQGGDDALGADVQPLDAVPGTSEGHPVPASSMSGHLPAVMGDPKQLVSEITAEQAKTGTWLWPRGEISSDGRFMVVVRGGVEPTLFVNDVAVPVSQIGERLLNRRERAQIIAWYGVDLLPGANRVEVRTVDPYGNERTLASGEFKRPAAGVRMRLNAPEDSLPADGGRSSVPVTLRILDANGYPASGVYFVTLTLSDGDLLEPDLQPAEPGIQVRVENGEHTVHVRSTERTGPLEVHARVGELDAGLMLYQVASGRSLFVNGLVDVGGHWQRNSGDTVSGDIERDFDIEGRLAVFMKGRIRNDLHLTLSYDNRKSSETDLLRERDPSEQYATYGDASVSGYEAQSRSKLYARLERDRHSIMWGDYLTDSRAENGDLARDQHTLTGLNAVFDNASTRVQLFAARQENSRAVEELRGNGTAMLFQLTGAPIVANSEVVERVVRDADNPGLELSVETLTRFVDYTLDNQTGLLSFSDTVPSVDADLNPVYLRIRYERQSNLDEYTISGVRMRQSLGGDATLGLSLTDDSNPLTGYTLAGARLATPLGESTRLVASVAGKRHRDGRNRGIAGRVEIEHLWQGSRDYRTLMSWARATQNFDNASSGIAAGREEMRIEHRHRLGAALTLTGEALHSESLFDQSLYRSLGVRLERRLPSWTLTLGGRRVLTRQAGSTLAFNTLLLGAEKRLSLPGGRSVSVGAEYEQALGEAERYRFSLTSRTQLSAHVFLYGRYDRYQGLTAQNPLLDDQLESRLTAGIESDVLPSTTLYSEYRLRGSDTGRAMEAASGVRGRYEVRPGVSVSPTLEVIRHLSGSEGEDAVAASLGVVDSSNPNRKLSAQIESRHTDSARYQGFRASAAQRLTVDWTGMVREEFTRQVPRDGEVSIRQRLTLGLARRPKTDNRHHALVLARWNEDYGPQEGDDRRTLLLSTHQNRQLNPHFSLSGRAGAKWQTLRLAGGDARSRTLLTDVRATTHWRRRWEFDLRAGLLRGDRGGARYSFGTGAAWLMDRNLRIGAAYNWIGFREDDLDAQGENRQGFRLGFHYKFDEDAFQWLAR